MSRVHRLHPHPKPCRWSSFDSMALEIYSTDTAIETLPPSPPQSSQTGGTHPVCVTTGHANHFGHSVRCLSSHSPNAFSLFVSGFCRGPQWNPELFPMELILGNSTCPRWFSAFLQVLWLLGNPMIWAFPESDSMWLSAGIHLKLACASLE